MSDTTLHAAALLAVLVLPVSALVARRLPLREALRYAAIWAGIITLLSIVLLLFT